MSRPPAPGTSLRELLDLLDLAVAEHGESSRSVQWIREAIARESGKTDIDPRASEPGSPTTD